MTEHSLFYYPYASLLVAQLPLLRVAAMWFDKLVIVDPAGVSRATNSTDRDAQEAVSLMMESGGSNSSRITVLSLAKEEHL